MKRLTNILCLAMSLFFTFSCGLMELEEDLPQVDVKMFFERDTIYVMQGESFAITPIFDPDTIPLSDVYWTSTNEDVVSFNLTNGNFTAVSEGWSTIFGTSVLYQKEDSCHVCVLPEWSTVVPSAPYETIFYADVTVHGKPFDPATMMLGAFVGEELRGVGIMREQYGVRYMEIRVGSEIFDEVDPFDEFITFRIFDKSAMRCESSKTFVMFDGTSHGTLSNLFRIDVR